MLLLSPFTCIWIEPISLWWLKVTDLIEWLYPHRPEPVPHGYFRDLVIQIGTSVSQPIRYESDDLMSGWVLYIVLDITTPPLPVSLLLLGNLLRYRGPTTVKLALCLDPTPWAWALGCSSQGLYGLVEVSPSCPSPINSAEPHMTSEEAGWTVRGAHLHHALGTS